MDEQRPARRVRLMLLLFAAFLVSVYAWVSRGRVPWSSGVVDVLLLELVPPGTPVHPNLRRLNDEQPSADASLETAELWLEREYAGYVRDGAVDVRFSVSGPHAVDYAPPELWGEEPSRWELLRRAWAYYAWHRDLAKDLGVPFSDYDARIVVVLQAGTGDIESTSVGDPKQRFGVVRLDAEVPDPSYALITLLHELGHTFGGTDKYDEGGFLAVWPEGYADPFRQPLFPQVQAELMAVDLPLGPGREREPEALRELMIGPRTAAEFGWIPRRTADRYYDGLPAVPPGG